tara:strand:- start:206 stop:649 length:444 start_codon:yes stop_codon:yes gene_type:complete
MKIKIIKKSKLQEQQIDEALKDYIFGAALSFTGMFGGGKDAQAGVENISDQNVERIEAFAKEGYMKASKAPANDSKATDQLIKYDKILKDAKAAKSTKKDLPMSSFSPEFQNMAGFIVDFSQRGEKEKQFLDDLVKKNKSIDISSPK